jgi:hypothetical protein
MRVIAPQCSPVLSEWREAAPLLATYSLRTFAQATGNRYTNR